MKAEVVADYYGLERSAKEYHEMLRNNPAAIQVEYVLEAQSIEETETIFIEPSENGKYRMGHYLNHSLSHPSVKPFRKKYQGKLYIVFIAQRQIDQGEQLTYTYSKGRKEAAHDHPSWWYLCPKGCKKCDGSDSFGATSSGSAYDQPEIVKSTMNSEFKDNYKSGIIEQQQLQIRSPVLLSLSDDDDIDDHELLELANNATANAINAIDTCGTFN